MTNPQRNVGSSTQARKRTSAAGLVIAAVVLMALIGATFALTRTSAATPVAKAAATVAVQATSAPAKAPATGATAAQVATASPSAKSYTFGGATLQSVTAQDGVVRLPVADLGDSKAHFYAFQANGKLIPFFVLKSSDGVIRAAFDACDVCFSAKKGYHQEGDEMVCNNCGNRFPSTQINVVTGGCNPGALDRQVQGDSIIIQVADLAAGAKYF